MDKTFPTIETLKKALLKAGSRYPIMKVELFGSLAKGDFTVTSDIDLLVDFLPDASIGLFEMGALKEDLEEELGVTVDLVNKKSIENSSNIYVKKSILNSPVPLYSK